MIEGQHKNTINKSQGNMAPSEHSYTTATSPGYPNKTEAQENELKCNLTKLIGTFKEEINKFLKEIQENTIKQVKEMNKNCSRLENGSRSNK